MHDIGFEPKEKTIQELPAEMRKIAINSVAFGWQQREVRMLILAGLVVSVFTAWGFYAWQPHFLALLGQDLPLGCGCDCSIGGAVDDAWKWARRMVCALLW